MASNSETSKSSFISATNDNVLGQVLGQPDELRGPDVEYSIVVPRPWIDQRATIEIELPRHLNCSRCHGGGCDTCGRAGAVTLRSRDMPAEPLRVTLPADRQEQQFCLRVPKQGGEPLEPIEQGLPSEGLPSGRPPRGLLLLTISVGAAASSGVALAVGDGAEGHTSQRRELMLRSSLMAIGLIVAFLAMLRLSGWL